MLFCFATHYSFFARFKSTDLCIILVSGTWQSPVCLFELNWIPEKMIGLLDFIHAQYNKRQLKMR